MLRCNLLTLSAFQTVLSKVTGPNGWANPKKWTPKVLLNVIDSNQELRNHCDKLCMKYRGILYGSFPIGWGEIPPDLRGQLGMFAERKSSLRVKGAGKGVFAEKLIKAGTALCYGGILVPYDDDQDEFEGSAYNCRWKAGNMIIGIPMSNGAGYLAPLVNEPRQCTEKRPWHELPPLEKANCVYGENASGVYIVTCCELSKSHHIFFMRESLNSKTQRKAMSFLSTTVPSMTPMTTKGPMSIRQCQRRFTRRFSSH